MRRKKPAMAVTAIEPVARSLPAKSNPYMEGAIKAVANAAMMVKVETEADYFRAADIVKDVKRMGKVVDTLFAEEKARVNRLKIDLLENIRRYSDPIDTAEAHVKAEMLAFQSAPEVKGVSKRESWTATLDNLDEVIQGVAAGTIPKEVLTFNQTAANELARRLGGAVQYPGIRWERRSTLAVEID